MKRHSDRHALTTLSELNVTPLLDLAFVLLIIFMITTPLMENSVELVVPTSEAAKNAVDPSAVQTVSINQNEELQLNGTDVSMEEMERSLSEKKTGRSDLAVVIRAHKDLPVQQLLKIMDAVERVGIAKIGVVANPEN